MAVILGGSGRDSRAGSIATKSSGSGGSWLSMNAVYLYSIGVLKNGAQKAEIIERIVP